MYQAPSQDTSNEFKKLWVPLREQIKFSIAMGAWYEDLILNNTRYQTRFGASADRFDVHARPLSMRNSNNSFGKWGADEVNQLKKVRNEMILGNGSDIPDSVLQEAFCHVAKGKYLGKSDKPEDINKTLTSSIETFRKKLQTAFADQVGGMESRGGYILDTTGLSLDWWTCPIDLGKPSESYPNKGIDNAGDL
jgi:hypothetical protein